MASDASMNFGIGGGALNSAIPCDLMMSLIECASWMKAISSRLRQRLRRGLRHLSFAFGALQATYLVDALY